jgi:hypothetical protein
VGVDAAANWGDAPTNDAATDLGDAASVVVATTLEARHCSPSTFGLLPIPRPMRSDLVRRIVSHRTSSPGGTGRVLVIDGGSAFAPSVWASPADTFTESRRSPLERAAFLFLRASPKVVKEAREKIVPLDPATASAYVWCAKAIDRTLRGVLAMKRVSSDCGVEVDALVSDTSLELAADDPAWVRAKAKATEPMSVHIAHIAGPSCSRTSRSESGRP